MRATTLYVDQYGARVYARTVADLASQCGRRRAARMYQDRGERTYHVGYIVAGRWFTAYAPKERLLS